jgi:hypothetical protein
MRIKVRLLALLAPGFLAACATGPQGPAGDAYYGKPEELMALVRSGQHPLNERMDQRARYYNPTLPICAVMSPYPKSIAAAEELLSRGARVDLLCEADSNYPIDRALFTYSVYADQRRPAYDRSLAQAFEKLVLRMASMGAMSTDGPVTSEEAARRAMGESIVKIRKIDADYAKYLEDEAEKERVARQRSRESSSSSGTLAGLATIAGMAASNYQAANAASRQATIPLPIADVQKFAPSTPAAAHPVRPTATRPSSSPAPQPTARAPASSNNSAATLVAAATQSQRVGSGTSSASSGFSPSSSAPPRPVYTYRLTETVTHSTDTWKTEAEAVEDVMRELKRNNGSYFGLRLVPDPGDTRLKKEAVRVGTPVCKSYKLAGGVLNWWCNVDVEFDVVAYDPPSSGRSSGAGISR